METEIFQILAAGGDVGVWALIVVIVRFDKRVSRIEWKLGLEKS